MESLAKICLSLRKDGLRKTARMAYYKYGRVNRFYLFKWELAESAEELGRFIVPEGCAFVDSDLAVLARVREDHPGLPREFYVDQMYEGRRFFLLFHEGEVASIVWAFGKGEWSRYYELATPETAELAYIYTLPKFRGRRVQALVVNYVASRLWAEGVRRIVVAISQGNVNSIRGVSEQRTGFRQFDELRSWFSVIRKRRI